MYGENAYNKGNAFADQESMEGCDKAIESNPSSTYNNKGSVL